MCLAPRGQHGWCAWTQGAPCQAFCPSRTPRPRIYRLHQRALGAGGGEGRPEPRGAMTLTGQHEGTAVSLTRSPTETWHLPPQQNSCGGGHRQAKGGREAHSPRRRRKGGAPEKRAAHTRKCARGGATRRCPSPRPRAGRAGHAGAWRPAYLQRGARLAQREA